MDVRPGHVMRDERNEFLLFDGVDHTIQLDEVYLGALLAMLPGGHGCLRERIDVRGDPTRRVRADVR